MEYYGSDMGAAAGMGMGASLVWLALLILMVAAQWKLFSKAGEAGWKCLIPFYNSYIQFKILYGNGWKFLLLLIPLANIFFAIKAIIDNARVYGKSTGFGVGMLFFGIIFYPMLAFGKSEYTGPIQK